jgi:hypothetical protein
MPVIGSAQRASACTQQSATLSYDNAGIAMSIKALRELLADCRMALPLVAIPATRRDASLPIL